MGGIGKTTLAQYVYNDEQVKAHFDLMAWVCVSDVFDVKRVTKDIINSAILGINFDGNNLNEAQEKLQEVVKEKKFFVVLDDVWSEGYVEWNQLQIPFLGAARGSRVIVTTRNAETAMVMSNHCPDDIIYLEGLSDEYCWSIFQQHVNTMYPDLSERQDDIIRKCNGLPLAAKTLGGLLRKTVDRVRRQRILDSPIWSDKCETLPVLRLSYQHLPSHLKCLFAYCSVLPKDYQFKEMEIIQLWMAQGFLPDKRNERMEDVGHDYFIDLVSRSLFEKRLSDYKEEEFIMHDLIHDVAQFAAGNICNVIVDGTDTQSNLRRTRHLFITEHVQTLGTQIMASHLRTLLCNYGLTVDHSDFFKKFRYIRTLSLCSDVIEILPECIGDLKHLCYLSLSFERIKELPQSVRNLWNLQTLCLKGCDELQTVPCIESLGKLRHLTLRRSYWYTSLKEMPHGIGKLTNLHTLDVFVLAAGGGPRVRELGMLNNLRGRLDIVGLKYVAEIEDAKKAELNKKESLDELYMDWKTFIGEDQEVDDKTKRDVIEKLQPHTNIRECGLDGYMGSKFPSWLGDPSFSNMVEIHIFRCEKCECLPPLGQLPSLKSLFISYMDGIKEVGLEFYGRCSTPFQSLSSLHISSMKSWEKWVLPEVDNKAFPILRYLYIGDCPSLQVEIPPHLPSLKHLEINGCGQLQSLDLKNYSSSASHLGKLFVKRCKSIVSIRHIPLTLQSLGIEECNSIVSIRHIPLTLQSLGIDRCNKLEYVEYDEQPTNLSPGSDVEKGLKSEDSIGVSPKASLELSLLTQFRIEGCPSLRSLQENLLLPALAKLDLRYSE